MILDKEIAERFLKGPKDDESLDSYSHLTEEAAELLTQHRGRLHLSGLVEISEPCARILGRASAYQLYLDGIKTVDSATLKNLLGPRSVVCLRGLRTLPEIGDSWVNLDETIGELYLDGLEETTAKALKIVSSVAYDFLSLNGLESLPQDDEKLFGDTGAQLFLDGIKNLTEIDLRILGSNLRPSQSLILGGLDSLDARQAEMLVGTDRGAFSIGLRRMSDEVASILLRSQSYSFIMDRLEELTPFAAEICGRYIFAQDVYFNGLQQISDEAFELLLADYTGQENDWFPGSFHMNGLSHLTPRMRKTLEKTKHTVSLNGVEDAF